MPRAPFCFVHAADFHLEQPLYGLAEAPDHLRDLLVEAPYAAARGVFETAILEEADFLILAGDILDAQSAEPYAIAFLMDQLKLLRQHGVAVYWVGGRTDSPDRWPEALRLPEGVRLFAAGGGEAVTHYRGEQPLAAIWGESRSGRKGVRGRELQALGGELFTIAVAHDPGDLQWLRRQSIDYWALGGRPQRGSLDAGPHGAHFPGRPQGRCPSETGPHGCELVRVGADGDVRRQAVPTDVVRWREETITLEDKATREELELILCDRVEQIAAAEAGRCSLVLWTVIGGGRLGAQLRNGGLADQLIQELRRQFGRRSPAIWTVSLAHTPPESWPSQWYEEDTILGDFLRAVREYETHGDELLDLAPCLSPKELAGPLAPAAEISDAKTRAQVLRKAAVLGVDLLRGGESA